MELLMHNNMSNVGRSNCSREADIDKVSKYLSFRVCKNLDIEPETRTTNYKDKYLDKNFVLETRLQCVCGCTYEGEEDDDEYLSAYEVENWQDSSESVGNSSASSFAFPVLDARWSGSPVQMPKRRPEDKKLGFLKKPKLAARIVCRWCRSF